ncbi:alcohol dehydrogenase catalytic domain-containing protein [Streptomyces sp. AGS-58]|uniref:alcohol dehydrogenase catalytic domain-containing protein n=1 Tax=unclassified Streptomyces TaxID=2593676 RepID=UPI0035A3C53C
MRAFMVEKYGDRAGMRAAELPDPQVGADDVLVKIHAAGVNPLDLRIRSGDFKAFMPYRLPLVLGNDLAGTVVRVGPSVTRFAVGDEVYSRPDNDRIGTFAELIAVHQDDLAPKPATLTMTEAASLPLVALTAWQALVERARVQPGQKVDKAISLSSFRGQLKAIHRWGLQAPADLSLIRQPVLVANGESDRMVPSVNSIDLAARLPQGELEPLYPDAGHGGIFQYHDRFVPRALEFLEP